MQINSSHKKRKLSKKVGDIVKSMASHSKNPQAFGLFVIFFVKLVLKHLSNVTRFTPTKKYRHCKRLETETPPKEECPKCGKNGKQNDNLWLRKEKVPRTEEKKTVNINDIPV